MRRRGPFAQARAKKNHARFTLARAGKTALAQAWKIQCFFFV